MRENMNVPVQKAQTLTAYDPQQNAALYNRLGQFYYRLGDMDRAKALFFLSKLYDGTFQLDPSLFSQNEDCQ